VKPAVGGSIVPFLYAQFSVACELFAIAVRTHDVSVPHVYVPGAVSEYTCPAVAAAVIEPSLCGSSLSANVPSWNAIVFETVTIVDSASSSIVLSSLVVVGVAFTFTVFVKYAELEVVNTETYEPVFLIITFEVGSVAWIVYAVAPL
jgi:hypothetical protein